MLTPFHWLHFTYHTFSTFKIMMLDVFFCCKKENLCVGTRSAPASVINNCILHCCVCSIEYLSQLFSRFFDEVDIFCRLCVTYTSICPSYFVLLASRNFQGEIKNYGNIDGQGQYTWIFAVFLGLGSTGR